jgi:hypothetical protein
MVRTTASREPSSIRPARRAPPGTFEAMGPQFRWDSGNYPITARKKWRRLWEFLDLDFLGDASNYAISLFVVGMALRYRGMAAMAKGATMGAFGLWVIGVTGWHAVHGRLPSTFTMGAVGLAALVANAASFGLLWAFRGGDANMRSAWVCTRNDVLGNVAVLLER